MLPNEATLSTCENPAARSAARCSAIVMWRCSFLETTITKVVVAHQVGAARREDLANRGVKRGGVSLVTQFLNGLIRHHHIE